MPGFAGFYSQDGILGVTLAFAMARGTHYLPFILGISAAALTAFYMFRIIFMTFTGQPRDQQKFDHAHESGWTMTVPLMTLAVLSIVAAGWKSADTGWFARFSQPYDVPAIATEFGLSEFATEFDVEHAPADVPAEHATADEHAADEHAAAAEQGAATAHEETDLHAEAATDADHGTHDAHAEIHHRAHSIAMKLSIAVALLGILASWFVYYRRKVDTDALRRGLNPAYRLLQGQYFFDEFYAVTVIRGTLWIAWLSAAFDRYIIDGIVNGSGYLLRTVSWIGGQIDNWVVDGAVNGVATIMQSAGEGLRRFQTGRLQTYLTYVTASVVVLVLIYRAL